jgi:hypothetical protein
MRPKPQPWIALGIALTACAGQGSSGEQGSDSGVTTYDGSADVTMDAGASLDAPLAFDA